MLLAGFVTRFDKYRRFHVMYLPLYDQSKDSYNTMKQTKALEKKYADGSSPLLSDGFKAKISDKTIFEKNMSPKKFMQYKCIFEIDMSHFNFDDNQG